VPIEASTPASAAVVCAPGSVLRSGFCYAVEGGPSYRRGLRPWQVTSIVAGGVALIAGVTALGLGVDGASTESDYLQRCGGVGVPVSCVGDRADTQAALDDRAGRGQRARGGGGPRGRAGGDRAGVRPGCVERAARSRGGWRSVLAGCGCAGEALARGDGPDGGLRVDAPGAGRAARRDPGGRRETRRGVPDGRGRSPSTRSPLWTLPLRWMPRWRWTRASTRGARTRASMRPWRWTREKTGPMVVDLGVADVPVDRGVVADVPTALDVPVDTPARCAARRASDGAATPGPPRVSGQGVLPRRGGDLRPRAAAGAAPASTPSSPSAPTAAAAATTAAAPAGPGCAAGQVCDDLGHCVVPSCGAGNFTETCSNGALCPSNSLCTADNLCACRPGYVGRTCAGADCGTSCAYPQLVLRALQLLWNGRHQLSGQHHLPPALDLRRGGTVHLRLRVHGRDLLGRPLHLLPRNRLPLRPGELNRSRGDEPPAVG
jgi:hypothetical protein